ncbi:hypothetical protein [Amycolatopsis samaneae]|uniref:Transcriptional regulator n=1 Tax=Amycolatopsis samaneae TaxID=664691 RepID=A0ABW5GRN7_9PSEU
MSAKTPYGWLKGSFPRGQLPEFVAAILSRKIGRTIEVNQIWPGRGDRDTFGAHDPAETPWTQEQVIRALRRLGQGARGKPVHHTGGTLVSIAVDWLAADGQQARPRNQGTRVTPRLAGVLAPRLAQLRELERTQHGLLLADWNNHDLRWVAHLLDEGSYDTVTGRLLYTTAAELAHNVGWLLTDQGRYAEGQHYELTALRTAALARDRQLGAYVLSWLADHLTWYGRPQDALRLLAIARTGVEETASDALRALLAIRQALAHAQLGEESACDAAAAEAAATPAGAGTPGWLRWFGPGVLLADTGRAWLKLGHFRRAEELLASGLARLGEHRRRERLLYSAWLAEARLAIGELDGAVELAHTALTLAETVDSVRARRCLETLRRSFAGYDTAQVRAVVDRIRETGPLPQAPGC